MREFYIDQYHTIVSSGDCSVRMEWSLLKSVVALEGLLKQCLWSSDWLDRVLEDADGNGKKWNKYIYTKYIELFWIFGMI